MMNRAGFNKSLTRASLVAIATMTLLMPATSSFAQSSPPALPATVSAAKDQNWPLLESLISDGIGANSIYADGTSALHWASHHDNLEAVQRLLSAGADVNASTDLGVTALWLAAENGSAVMTESLLNAGADPNISLIAGESILMTAALTGSADVVRLLLEAGADPDISITRDQTALMWAASQGHAEVVEALVEYGADVHARTELRRQYVKNEKEQDSHPIYKRWEEQGHNTALMFAASAGDLDSAKALLVGGSDVNAVSALGNSPAILAVHGGNSALLEYLLENGADPDSDAGGHTALHAAVLRGNLEAVEVLLSHGANLEAKLESGTATRRQSADYSFHDALIGATPLWLAARFAEPQIMRALIDAGADPFTQNNVSYPAQRRGENYIAEEGEHSILMAAVGMGYRRLRLSWGNEDRRAGRLGQSQESFVLEAASIAIGAGVDVNLRDASGQSAIDAASARRWPSVVSLLERSGAVSQ